MREKRIVEVESINGQVYFYDNADISWSIGNADINYFGTKFDGGTTKQTQTEQFVKQAIKLKEAGFTGEEVLELLNK